MKTKLLRLTIFIFCLSSPNLFASNIPAGNVYGHWTLANSPYLVLGNITIPQDSLLQIDSGVVVQFQGHYQLHVLGRILALGTASNLITFSASSDWWGIRYDAILASQDSSLFIYCKIEKGNANGTGNYSNGGAFFIISFSKIRVEHCTITNNSASAGGAFYCDHADPKIYNNVINNNTASGYYGAGIYCNYSSPSISNNSISSNGGNIECENSSSPDIIGNTINHSSGVGIGCQNSSNPSIVNNNISYDRVGIVVVRSSPNIIGNLITYNSGNSYGGGMDFDDHSYPKIINNTIAYNTTNMLGGGIYLQGTSSPIIKNTILWGNSAPQGGEIALSQTCVPAFYNCDIQDSFADFYYYDVPNNFTGTYINNLDTNPLFINASVNDFSLQPTSPCINAGDTTGIILPLTDLAGSSRVCNNNIEIGAYEICATGIQDYSPDPNIISIYPNPAKDRITFEIFSIKIPENAQLFLTNILGENLKQVYINSLKITVQLDKFNSGIYFYQIKNANGFMMNGKFMIE